MGTREKAKVTVQHWHVSDSDAGCLPEAEPDVCATEEDALDRLAHRLKDWANSREADKDGDPEDSDAAYANGMSEIYCTCKERSGGERSAEYHDALAALKDGRGICEQIDHRVFEATLCQQEDCLKYCPDADCGTVAPATDPWCWCCDAEYVG